MTDPSRHAPVFRRVVLSCALGGVAASALELAWPLVLGERPLLDDDLLPTGVTYLLSLGALGGLVLGLLAGGLLALCAHLGRSRPPGFRNPGIWPAALILAGLVALQNRSTFEGAGIRNRPLRPWLEGGFLVLCVVTSVVLCRMLQGVLRRQARPAGGRAAGLLAGLCILVACGLFACDALLYRNLYAEIHLQITQAVVVCLSLLAWLLVTRVPPVVRTTLALGCGLLIAGGVAARFHPGLPRVRSSIATATIGVRQWMHLPERGLDLVRRPPQGAVADHRALPPGADEEQRAQVDEMLDELVPGRRKLSLLVLSVDTVRADHVGFLGSRRPTTPRLDRLARSSVVFERAYCQYPTSSQSFSSFFTGRFVGCAPVRWEMNRESSPLPRDLSLASRLAKIGARTVATTAFNRGTLEQRNVFGHLRDGFHVFNPEQTISYRRAPAITSAALRRLAEIGDERFMLWVHFLDPHHPYERNAAFDFGAEPEQRYDSEIALADDGIGRILDALRASGRADDTVIVFFSDHGEEFGEHKGRYHCTSLYEEQVRVPLLLHVPGLRTRRVRDVVGLMDVMPTLLRLFGLEDPYRRSGRSLWPLLLGFDGWVPFAFAELYPSNVMLGGGREMVVSNGLKLVRAPITGTEEIYELAGDPGERTNLLGRLDADRVAALRGLLVACREHIAGLGSGGAEPDRREDPVLWLRTRLKELEGIGGPELRGRIRNLAAKVLNPFQGLAPVYAGALRGELREPFLEAVQRAFDPQDVGMGPYLLRLAGLVPGGDVLDWLKGLESDRSPVLGELLTQRAFLGDESVRPALLRANALEGAPARHRLALALFALGDDRALDQAVLAGTTRRTPFNLRLLELLGQAQREELVPLAERMLRSRAWRGATLRMSLAEALGRLTSAPRRDRLLARLAHGYSHAVARRARNILERDLQSAAFDRVMAAGGAEAEADEGLFHRHFRAALIGLRRAVQAWSRPPASLVLKLASLEAAHGDVSRVRELLASLKAAGSSAGGARLAHLEQAGAWTLQPLPFTVQSCTLEPRALRRQWARLRVTLENTGAHLWPRGDAGFQVSFRPVVTDEKGVAVEAASPWAATLWTADVPPGGSVVLDLPFLAPPSIGRFTLGLRVEQTAPSGRVVRGPAAPVPGADLEVLPRLW